MDAASGATKHHNVKQAVPFFLVSDMERSLKYYVDGLGFEMKNKWVHEGKLRWCWLQLGDAAVMLQQFEIGPRPRARSKIWRRGFNLFHLRRRLAYLSGSCRKKYSCVRTICRKPYVGNGAVRSGWIQNHF